MVLQLQLQLDPTTMNQSSSSEIAPVAPDPSNTASPQPIYYDDGKSMPATKRAKSKGLVLVDAHPEVTLSSISSTFDPKVHLEFLINPKIYREIKKKQATLLAPQADAAPQLWMYFDSGGFQVGNIHDIAYTKTSLPATTREWFMLYWRWYTFGVY